MLCEKYYDLFRFCEVGVDLKCGGFYIEVCVEIWGVMCYYSKKWKIDVRRRL